MTENISSNDFAYIGDAFLELLVRRYLVETARVKNPSDEAVKFVAATAQSDAYARIEDSLTEEEQDVYRRARNNYHTSNVPKSATPAQYRRSTGFEAVFGYLYLCGNESRAKELFCMAYGLEHI